MNRLSFTVELAADGGVVVYADTGGTEQSLVFAGNTKDTCDYIAKRVGGLKAETTIAEHFEPRVMPGRWEAVPNSNQLRRIDQVVES